MMLLGDWFAANSSWWLGLVMALVLVYPNEVLWCIRSFVAAALLPGSVQNKNATQQNESSSRASTTHFQSFKTCQKRNKKPRKKQVTIGNVAYIEGTCKSAKIKQNEDESVSSHSTVSAESKSSQTLCTKSETADSVQTSENRSLTQFDGNISLSLDSTLRIDASQGSRGNLSLRNPTNDLPSSSQLRLPPMTQQILLGVRDRRRGHVSSRRKSSVPENMLINRVLSKVSSWLVLACVLAGSEQFPTPFASMSDPELCLGINQLQDKKKLFNNRQKARAVLSLI